MAIEDDADDNSENFPCGDNKRHNVLLKLFDHPVNENLAHRCQDRENKEVSCQLGVFAVEIYRHLELARHKCIRE